MNSMHFVGQLTGYLVLFLIVGFFLILFFLARKSARARSSSFSEADYVLHGASIIHDGHGYYPDWCAMMLREFDESATPYLERWFEAANFVAKHPQEEWRDAARKALREEPEHK